MTVADTALDLSVDLGRGLVLPNPILVASGTFGYGVEYGDVVDVDRLGGICRRAAPVHAKHAAQLPGDCAGLTDTILAAS